MHTGGVLGVYNARVLLEGINDGDWRGDVGVVCANDIYRWQRQKFDPYHRPQRHARAGHDNAECVGTRQYIGTIWGARCSLPG